MNAAVPAMSHAGTGAADGYFDATANTGFYPGGKAWLAKSDGTLSQFCLITDLNGTGKIGLRFLPEGLDDPKLRTGVVRHPNYGRSDLSAYTAGSILSMYAQVVPVDSPLYDPLPTLSV